MKIQNTITGCYIIDKFDIYVDKIKIQPEFSPIAAVCEGTDITLPTTSTNGITGHWLPEINSTTTTEYTFTPNPGQCATETTLTVKVIHPESLSITAVNTAEPFSKHQKVEVQAKGGSGTYEYKLNKSKWQSSNIFNDLTGCQDQLISVRDLKGCQNTKSAEIVIQYYPRYFTPNGDGYNDYWDINCLKHNYESITIFDRFGKFLTKLDSDSIGWDGTHHGVPLPSSDYWFIVTYFENGIEKQFKSHFTLKR
jgi:gliding motility-associated-like protein